MQEALFHAAHGRESLRADYQPALWRQSKSGKGFFVAVGFRVEGLKASYQEYDLCKGLNTSIPTGST